MCTRERTRPAERNGLVACVLREGDAHSTFQRLAREHETDLVVTMIVAGTA